MLDAKIASALNKIIPSSQFKKKVSLEEQKTQKEDRFLRGRQIAFMIYDYFRVTGAHDTVLDYAVIYSLSPFAMIIFRNSIQDGMKKISKPDYQKLKTMVKRSIDQKLRLRNFDARHGRIESGAVVESREELTGVAGGKGICYQWKERGHYLKGDQCSFWHESNDQAQTPTPNAATPSEPSLSRGRSVSWKRSIRGKSNRRAILRQPCRYILKGTCTRTSCEYWLPPECQFNKNETGCDAGNKCLFPRYMVDEQPNKKPKKGCYSQRRRESEDKDAVTIAKTVSQLGCVS